MLYFGQYLKDYLKSNNMSQSEFAIRLGITQKHMNEILNGKKNITLEMAADIERLTGISSKFIITIENNRNIYSSLIKKYNDEENLKRSIKIDFPINELKKRNWVVFRDEKSIIQICIDLLNFLKIKDFEVLKQVEENVLFKKDGTDLKKLNLWISRCDDISNSQLVGEYNSDKFSKVIEELKEYSFNKSFKEDDIREILNKYGIFFVVEKPLDGTKVRGAFKVRGKKPAIYLTQNYNVKDSFYYALFHELGHCKSDYNDAQKKVIIDGDQEKENRADEFALNTMIENEIWDEITRNLSEPSLLVLSQKYKIPMSFIVGRLAKKDYIKYNSVIYNKYKNV